jgi:hopanoid biosynthesis associated RND transporter like protein HpnN
MRHVPEDVRLREKPSVTPREPGPPMRKHGWSGTPTLWLITWIRFVRRHGVAVLAFSLVSALLAGAYATLNVGINTSTSDMLSKDLPFQRQFDELDRAFPQDYRSIVAVIDGDTTEHARGAAERLAARLKARPDVIRNVFYPEGDPFFRRNGLLFLSVQQLEALSNTIAGAQPLLAALSQDPSLRGLAQVLTLALGNIDQAGGQLPPQFEAALDGIAATVELVQAGRAAWFSWRGTMAGDIDPQFGGKRQFLLLEPTFEFNSLQPADRAIHLIRGAAAELQLTPEHGVRVRLTGQPVMLEEELQSVRDSIGMANLLALAIVLVIITVGLRSGRLVEATTFSLLVGLAWTACFAVVVFRELNLISVAFAVLFIGFGVDFGIHVCMRAKEYIDAQIGPGLAVEEAALGVAPGLTLTTISASIGFLAFGPTAYRGLVELGIISSVGMVVALVTSLSIVPAYLSLRTPRRSDVRQQLAVGAVLEQVMQRRARGLLWGALILGMSAAAVMPLARFDDSPLDLRDPRTEGVSTLYDLLEDGHFDPYRAAILAKNAAEAGALADKLRALPEVRRVETLSDLVPDRQEEKLAILGDLSLMLTPVLTPAEQRPPPATSDLRAAIAEVHDAAEAAAGRNSGARRLAEALDGFAPTDDNLARLQTALIADLPPMLADLRTSLDATKVSLADVPPTLRARRQAADGRVLVEALPKAKPDDQSGRRRFAAAVQSVAPEATGDGIAVSEAGKAVIRSFLQAGAFAFVTISALLIVVLRSVRDAATVMAPLVLAGLLTVATTVVIDVPFNFANVIVLPLLVGLGVSSGINMVVRGRQQGARSLLVTSTPRAVLFSALTTIGSFGSLALSTHRGMASMGLLLMVALTFTTACTLIVLPALRHVFASAARSWKPNGRLA